MALQILERHGEHYRNTPETNQFFDRAKPSYVDIGAAQGALPVQIALRHARLQGGRFNLPVVRHIYGEYVASFRLNQCLPFYRTHLISFRR